MGKVAYDTYIINRYELFSKRSKNIWCICLPNFNIGSATSVKKRRWEFESCGDIKMVFDTIFQRIVQMIYLYLFETHHQSVLLKEPGAIRKCCLSLFGPHLDPNRN